MVELTVAVVLRVCRGKNSDDHGDGPVPVQEADDDANTTDQNTPAGQEGNDVSCL